MCKETKCEMLNKDVQAQGSDTTMLNEDNSWKPTLSSSLKS
jgi:hypothetical protein